MGSNLDSHELNLFFFVRIGAEKPLNNGPWIEIKTLFDFWEENEIREWGGLGEIVLCVCINYALWFCVFSSQIDSCMLWNSWYTWCDWEVGVIWYCAKFLFLGWIGWGLGT